MLLAQGCCAMCAAYSDLRPHRDDYWISSIEPKERVRASRPNVPVLQRNVTKSHERYYSASPRMSISPKGVQIDMKVQSEKVQMGEEQEGSDMVQQENVGYSDLSAGMDVELKHDVKFLRGDTSQNVELGNYLRRPVLIDTQTWDVGNTLDIATDNFKPWHLFFSKPAIKRKLDNYYMLKCNLKLKFVINASPFYYSGVLVSYQPMTNFNPAPVVIGSGYQEYTLLSQRPHCYLYPQTSQGANMTLPFLYHKEWLDATSANDLQNMGTIYFGSFGALLTANGIAGTSCTIQTYAWAEDVEIAGPTLDLAVQSQKKKFSKGNVKSKHKNDEYQHEGTISKPASAIARATGMLSQVPVIGPFMTATSYAAEATASIASLFGYTNVPVIDDVHAFRSAPFPQFASTDIGTPIEKATLDCKNELSIDSRICGVDLHDELLISNFVARESYLVTSTWAATDPVDEQLFATPVGPVLYNADTTTGGRLHYPTPMQMVSQMFDFWRGDIEFRFKFLASAYHRGRVRISWDPTANISSNSDNTTEIYTKIVDITEDSDVSFVVPYTQPTAYLPTTPRDLRFRPYTPFTTVVNPEPWANGTLTVRVLTEQTSPVASADIQMLVFVRGCDNLEFASPRQIDDRFSPYVVQSKQISYDDDYSNIMQMGIKPSQAYDEINLVYMGEKVESLRTLMRRTVIEQVAPDPSTTSGDVRHRQSLHRRRLPLYPGYDPNGIHDARNNADTANVPYNFVPWNPITWISTCFVGNRGSIHWTANIFGTSNTMAYLGRGSTTNLALTASNANATFSSVLDKWITPRAWSVDPNAGMNGFAITNTGTQTSLNLSAPLYSRYKFISNSITTRTLGSSVDETTKDSIELQTIRLPTSEVTADSKAIVHMFCSAGTDFNLIFFLNCPTLYYYDVVPNPGT
jgi:hypothetical protein